MNNYPNYKELCTCGDYQPYEVIGCDTNLLQPSGSCTHCYLLPLADQANSWYRDDLDDAFKKSLEMVDAMTPEEVEKLLYGLWRADEEEDK